MSTQDDRRTERQDDHDKMVGLTRQLREIHRELGLCNSEFAGLVRRGVETALKHAPDVGPDEE
jgi:hypothetical protein